MTAICPNCGFRHREADEGTYASELDNVRLSAMQRKVLAAFASEKGGVLRGKRLIDRVFDDREDGGPLVPMKTIYLAIHRINKAISSRGWRLENEYRRGYRLVRFTP